MFLQISTPLHVFVLHTKRRMPFWEFFRSFTGRQTRLDLLQRIQFKAFVGIFIPPRAAMVWGWFGVLKNTGVCTIKSTIQIKCLGILFRIFSILGTTLNFRFKWRWDLFRNMNILFSPLGCIHHHNLKSFQHHRHCHLLLAFMALMNWTPKRAQSAKCCTPPKEESRPQWDPLTTYSW